MGHFDLTVSSFMENCAGLQKIIFLPFVVLGGRVPHVVRQVSSSPKLAHQNQHKDQEDKTKAYLTFPFQSDTNIASAIKAKQR